jgi:hypothetical protein
MTLLLTSASVSMGGKALPSPVGLTEMVKNTPYLEGVASWSSTEYYYWG